MVCNPQDKRYFGFVGLYAIFVIKHQVYRGENIMTDILNGVNMPKEKSKIMF